MDLASLFSFNLGLFLANPPRGPALDLGVVLLDAAVAWLILDRAVSVQRLLGTQAFTRMMGLLIAARGVSVRGGIVSMIHAAVL